jgi:hypothetical protein
MNFCEMYWYMYTVLWLWGTDTVEQWTIRQSPNHTNVHVYIHVHVYRCINPTLYSVQYTLCAESTHTALTLGTHPLSYATVGLPRNYYNSLITQLITGSLQRVPDIRVQGHILYSHYTKHAAQGYMNTCKNHSSEITYLIHSVQVCLCHLRYRIWWDAVVPASKLTGNMLNDPWPTAANHNGLWAVNFKLWGWSDFKIQILQPIRTHEHWTSNVGDLGFVC